MLRETAFEPANELPRVELDAGVEGPPLWSALADLRRSARERPEFLAALGDLGHAPRGDGHPVFVIPGFLSDARSTEPLRGFLAGLGYEVHDWGLGRNFGPRTAGRTGERLARHFVEVADRAGRRMSVIGWSLGGIMARQLARHAPGKVRRVITLGAPFAGDPRATNASFLYQLLTGQRFTHPDFQKMLVESRLPPPVPATAIYSRTDGIVAWQCCREPDAPHTENLEVDCSHGGLTAHPEVLLAIAERLAAPEPMPVTLPDEPPISWWRAVAQRFAEWKTARRA
jgi:hypothetical protein